MSDDSLIAALVRVQAALPDVPKDQFADTGSYTYRYADLASIHKAILPLLAANGLVWVTLPTILDDGRFVLAYKLAHVEGQTEEGWFPLPNGTPQQIGSAITYARRYCLCSVIGVAPEDDDGKAASTAMSAQSGDLWPSMEESFRSEILRATNLPALREVGKRIGIRHLSDAETTDENGQATTLGLLGRRRAAQLTEGKDSGE